MVDAFTTFLASIRQRARQPHQYQDTVIAEEASHRGLPRSAIRYTITSTQERSSLPLELIPQRATRMSIQPMDSPAPGGRVHWLVFIGVAMFVMMLGWVASTAVVNWWQLTQDDWHYGRPRTFQTDAVVGHNDSAAHPSHFLALNLNSHIEVIEFPGGDATHARIYLGPTLIGDGGALVPVTLTFQDVNGDGKPDMLIHVQGSTFVFINDQGTFRPAKPGDPVHLPG